MVKRMTDISTSAPRMMEVIFRKSWPLMGILSVKLFEIKEPIKMMTGMETHTLQSTLLQIIYALEETIHVLLQNLVILTIQITTI